MAQSLAKVLQPDGSYKWEMVELTEARTKGLTEKPTPEPKAEKPASTPKTTKKTKAIKVEEPIEPASEF